jgi:PhnB protein
MQLQPYLMFNGQCKEAFQFYERVLGGKIEMMTTFGDAPPGAGGTPESRDLIMHVRLVVGDAVLMGSDSPPQYYEKPQGISVSISVKDVSEGERIFNALAEGGKVNMQFSKTFWSPGFGMAVDRFGTPWMVNCEGEGPGA